MLTSYKLYFAILILGMPVIGSMKMTQVTTFIIFCRSVFKRVQLLTSGDPIASCGSFQDNVGKQVQSWKPLQ